MQKKSQPQPAPINSTQSDATVTAIPNAPTPKKKVNFQTFKEWFWGLFWIVVGLWLIFLIGRWSYHEYTKPKEVKFVHIGNGIHEAPVPIVKGEFSPWIGVADGMQIDIYFNGEIDIERNSDKTKPTRLRRFFFPGDFDLFHGESSTNTIVPDQRNSHANYFDTQKNEYFRYKISDYSNVEASVIKVQLSSIN